MKTASFTVKMATIHTDSAQRDSQFDGRIMDVATYPDGTFIAHQADLAGAVAVGRDDQDLHRHRQPHAARPDPVGDLPAQGGAAAAGTIEVQGSIPVLFSKWGIPNPSFTGFVTTQNHGIMEFLLDFRHA